MSLNSIHSRMSASEIRLRAACDARREARQDRAAAESDRLVAARDRRRAETLNRASVAWAFVWLAAAVAVVVSRIW